MSKRILIIDGQLFQTPAWARGMGRYSSCLLQAANKDLPYDEVVLLLNKNLPLSDGAKKLIDASLPQITTVYLSLKLPRADAIAQIHRRNKALISEFIEDQFNSSIVDFLQIGLFQSEYYPAFPDNSNVRNLLIFYDLIPYQYPKIYNPDRSYLYRFNSLFEADHFFAISETVKSDLHTILAVPLEKITNLDGGATLDYRTVAGHKSDIKLPKKYILSPSGNDYRKNNVRATQAFERFRTLSGENYKMVLTSHFDDAQRAELEMLSDNLVFTGVVDDAGLYKLFDHAEMLLFASEYEGLGLPILESVVFDKKIICSNISAFKEISDEAFYFFDPVDVESMSDALMSAERGDNWQQKKAHYKEISRKYTWESAAARLCDVCKQTLSFAESRLPKKKLAVVTPHLENDLGMASIVNALHTRLSEYQVDYYLETPPMPVDDEFRRASYLSHTNRSFDIRQFDIKRYHEYDAVIYHLKDGDRNGYTLTRALTMPGIVFLHSDSLVQAFANMVDRNIISNTRQVLETKIEEALQLKEGTMLGSLLDTSHAIVSVLGGNFSTRIMKRGGALGKHERKCLSYNPLLTHTYIKRPSSSRSRHLALFWDQQWKAEVRQEAVQSIRAMATSDAFDGARISIISLGLPDEQATALADEYLNVAVIGAISEFELDNVLATIDVVIDPSTHASIDSLVVSAFALQKGSVIYSRNHSSQFSNVGGIQLFRSQDALLEALADPSVEAKPVQAQSSDNQEHILHKLIDLTGKEA